MSPWELFFVVRAVEPVMCARCYGTIQTGDAVVRSPDPSLSPLWHRSCVFIGDGQLTAFRRAQRRKSQRRAIGAEPDPRQGELFGGGR